MTKKLSLLRQMLLVVALLVGGANCVWAETTAVYENDCSSKTGWTGTIYDGKTNGVNGGNTCLQLAPGANNKSTFFALSTDKFITPLPTNISSYTVDFYFMPKASKEFQMAVYSNKATVGNDGKILSGNYLAEVTVPTKGDTDGATVAYKINGVAVDGKTLTQEYYHFVVTVTGTTASFTLTTADGLTSKGSGSVTLAADETLGGIYFTRGDTRIDDITVTYDYEVVSAPSVSAATNVNTTTGARTLPVINGVSDYDKTVTTYWSATTELTAENYSTAGTAVEDNSITTTSDVVYLISVSSEGTCSDGVTSEASDWDIVWGSTASVALSSITNNGTSLSGPVFEINGPENHTYLAYTFTPDGGAESSRTVITSGAAYVPTAYGTLTVYTNRTGYLESSYSIPVSNIYTVDYSTDYTTYTENPFGSTYEDMSSNWWTGATAYKSTASSAATLGRLRFGNNSVTSLVIGYGVGRHSGNCSLQLRYVQKGNIEVLTINNTNSSGTNSGTYYRNILDTSGSGKQTELTSEFWVTQWNTVAKHQCFIPVSIPSVSATLGSNGYTTFASPYPLDLTTANLPTGLKAYKAAVDGTTVKFTELDQTVPANTGILLKGTASTPYDIPVVASGTAVSENAFLVNTGGTTFSAESGYTYFGMIKDSAPLTFGTFAPGTVAIPANKAYLKVADENLSRLVAVFDDETNGISQIENGELKIKNSVYDLQGRRVAKPTKGLYIVNGKKVIVK